MRRVVCPKHSSLMHDFTRQQQQAAQRATDSQQGRREAPAFETHEKIVDHSFIQSFVRSFSLRQFIIWLIG